MEDRIEIIDGTSYRVTERKGRLYTRKVIEIELTQLIHAKKKAQEIGGRNLTDLIRELIAGFNGSMGFGKGDKYIRDAGSLFDGRMSRHIQAAVYRALEEIGQCQVDANEN